MHLRKYFVSTLQMAEGRILNIDIMFSKNRICYTYYTHLSHLLSYYQDICLQLNFSMNVTMWFSYFLNF